MIEIKLGNSCGSCIHANKPKTPREHAAHYEVTKTERWCFKHNCHITRESTCDDHEGISRAAKTSFTKLKKYNERIVLVTKILELIGDKNFTINNYIFYKKEGWLWYKFTDGSWNYNDKVRTKESYCDKCLSSLLSILESQ